MKLERKSGVLLHPTSFPGPNGIGELGKWAFGFIDFLEETNQTLWQILPLGPTGYGDSPYSCFSAFAGNPLLISLDELAADGLLSASDFADKPDFNPLIIDFGPLIIWKRKLLEKAAGNFIKKAGKQDKNGYQGFLEFSRDWLDDYALFMSIKEYSERKACEQGENNSIWCSFWDKGLAARDKKAIDDWKKAHTREMEYHKIWQYLFYRQWIKIRHYANSRGIQIIGDIPIFVALDSADVWANRELFFLDKNGAPVVVSGVPPDYFSKTGQLWGNPLYNWDMLEKTDYGWWKMRMKWMLNLVDIIRIDHFRGLQAYWEIPAGEKTAVNGRWVKAGGDKMFSSVKQELGGLPIIVEDLGVITKDVNRLREKWKFPGMALLQFAFEIDEKGKFKAENLFLPHNHIRHQVVYTGSHDNDTIKGWYSSLDDKYRDLIRRYLGRPDHDIVWEFVRMAMSSSAAWALIPLQDLMELGPEARMNTPSTLGNNWAWRYGPEQLTDYLKKRLAEMTEMYGR